MTKSLIRNDRRFERREERFTRNYPCKIFLGIQLRPSPGVSQNNYRFRVEVQCFQRAVLNGKPKVFPIFSLVFTLHYAGKQFY